MPPTSPCPDIPSLQQLLRGQLPLPDGEPLYDHLGECDRCAEYARTFRTEDVLSAVVRGAAAADHPEDPSVAGLIADLTRRGPPEGPDDIKATALSDTLPPLGDANDTGRECWISSPRPPSRTNSGALAPIASSKSSVPAAWASSSTRKTPPCNGRSPSRPCCPAWPPVLRPASASCAKGGRRRRSITTTSFPSTRSARSVASPS